MRLVGFFCGEALGASFGGCWGDAAALHDGYSVVFCRRVQRRVVRKGDVGMRRLYLYDILRTDVLVNVVVGF